MIERGQITLESRSSYKLEKQEIGGGHHIVPSSRLFVNSKICELDVKGMYHTIVINNNLSFDTLNCACCKNDPTTQIHQDTINTINQNLKENYHLRM